MAARARDALTNIYYKKRKMKETVYHPAFIMLGGGGGGCFGVRFCCGEVGLHSVYLFFELTYKTIPPGFRAVAWVCPLSLGKFLWGSKRKKRKKERKKHY